MYSKLNQEGENFPILYVLCTVCTRYVPDFAFIQPLLLAEGPLIVVSHLVQTAATFSRSELHMKNVDLYELNIVLVQILYFASLLSLLRKNVFTIC